MPLFSSFKERTGAIGVLALVFFASLAFDYYRFLDFTSSPKFTKARVELMYPKGDHLVLKLKTHDGFCVYTTSREPLVDLRGRQVIAGLLTDKLSFFKTRGCFFAKSIYMRLLRADTSFAARFSDYFLDQHSDKRIRELYGALFFGKAVSKETRQTVTNLAIAHIIALSGFHLGVIFASLAALFFAVYPFFHKRYFPYRNTYRDLFALSFAAAVLYLLLVGFIPSLVRAFFMSVFAYFLASRNIRVLSFETLGFTALILIALFPRLLWSLGFFFSLAGVFYIFLFARFVRPRSKILYSALLSVFLFVAMTPLTFYFFHQASFYQFLSPALTLTAGAFLPLSLALHAIGLGSALDPALAALFAIKRDFFFASISAPLFAAYIGASLAAPLHRYAFGAFCVLSFGVFAAIYLGF